MGYLAEFVERLEWWKLFPANEILAVQPGEENFNHWVSVVKSSDSETIVVYIPEKANVKLYNPKGYEYSAQWFNPVNNTYFNAEIVQVFEKTHDKVSFDTGETIQVLVEVNSNAIEFTHDFENDMLVILKKK